MSEATTPRQIMSEELEELRKVIITNHIEAGQKASGRTARSLHVVVSEDRGTLLGRNPFDTLETGRKAGKVPENFTDIIKQWMKDKGISVQPIPYKTNIQHKYTPEERGVNSFAFLVARKIKEKGTRLFINGGRSDIYSNAIPETTRKIGDRLLELINIDISSIQLNGKETIQ